jgi:hypothetical protein
MRRKHELGGNDPRRHAAIGSDDGAEILFRELTGEMQAFRIDALDIARRVDILRKAR